MAFPKYEIASLRMSAVVIGDAVLAVAGAKIFASIMNGEFLHSPSASNRQANVGVYCLCSVHRCRDGVISWNWKRNLFYDPVSVSETSSCHVLKTDSSAGYFS